MKPKIAIPEEAIRDFCRRWQVREFTLFGSVLRDDFGADSDIDVLISFRPETQRGFTQLAAMRKELEKLWGRRVDLVDRRLVEASENYIRRRHILKHAETVYVELPSLMATLEPFIPPDEED
jgi:hypothetical protein